MSAQREGGALDEPRRMAMLEEMGLAPVWRLRDRGPAARQQSAADSLAVAASQPDAPAATPAPDASHPREGHIARMDWATLGSAVATCTACGLCKTRTNTVLGAGAAAAQWMIVGEAPGAEEDARGEAFVGQAGRLLDNMLAAIGRSRATDVYIANVLKCRPPGNRNPEPFEVAQCSPFLLRQIDLVQPRLLVAMGRFAAQTLLATDASIASLRGRVHRYHGVPCIVTYHPAYLLRNMPDKAKAWQDLCFARAVSNELESGALRPA